MTGKATGRVARSAPEVTGAAATVGMVGLRRFNLAAGALHLLQGIVMLAVSNDFSLPLTTSFLKFDPASRSLDPNPEQVGSLLIGPAVALFLLLSAAAHFSVASFGWRWYVERLRRGINPARWLEYSVSASLMIVIIAMLTGLYDATGLLMIFALNATMIGFGYLMELHNQSTARTDWTAFTFGCLAGIVPWVVVACYMIGAAASVDTSIPGFVYAIIASIFIFFNIFALNMLLQYAKVGPWRSYIFGEKAYIILSLTAKSALAWQIFSGTLRPM